MRLTGAALLTLAGLLAGVLAAERLRRRVLLRQQLGQMLEQMAFELGRFKTPLPVLFPALAEQLSGPAGELCRRAAQALADGDRPPMARIWAGAVEALPERERAILLPLGSVLGRYGAEEQLRALHRARAAMARAEAEARTALGRKGRVYVGVSTAGAAALAVLLL